MLKKKHMKEAARVALFVMWVVVALTVALVASSTISSGKPSKSNVSANERFIELTQCGSWSSDSRGCDAGKKG